jgi:hypothetical protein
MDRLLIVIGGFSALLVVLVLSSVPLLAPYFRAQGQQHRPRTEACHTGISIQVHA